MLFTLIFPFILQVIRSSIVYDGSRQQGVHVSEYCPKMKYCAEGTHVMCMYYNPAKLFGDRCSNPRNVTMLPILAERLLEVANAIRSKIARGAEKGKNGELLPRGYGIFRLSWDKELATFAQVLANQCVLRHDMCRATKRFPDPGQTVGVVRFKYPYWFPLAKSKNFSTADLNEEKLQYAATQSLKSWYFQKKAVDKEMISNYPNWVEHPDIESGRNYLEMIYGPATHMGCGVSAYTEYAFYQISGDGKTGGGTNYNSVQIICNFSARPRTGGAVYNTVPPGDTETPISRCGCPVGSEGDSECLCITKEQEKESLGLQLNDCDNGSCDPTVVVLPIFTMEDKPPEHLFNSFSNSSVDKSADIIDSIFDEHEHNHQINENKKYLNGQTRHFNKLLQTEKKIVVKKRNFDKKDTETKSVDTRYNRPSLKIPPKHVPKKSSIFTRASRFSLPTARNNKEYSNIHPIQRDVVPRRDFSDAKKLVDKYIYGKSGFFKPMARKSLNENDIHHPENGNDLNEIIKPHSNEEVPHVGDVISHSTESSLSLIEQNVVHHDDFVKDISKDSILNHNEPIQSISATTDSKLMNLLDTLEREVKHIELKDKDKEIFDEKIRKIYGKLVGKPAEALGLKVILPDKHESKNHLEDHSEKHRTDRRDFNGHSDIADKHELLKDKNDLSFEVYDDPTAVNHHNVQRKVRDRSMYRNNDVENDYRNKNGYRNIEHNDIESHEHKYDDFDFNYRKGPFKREHYSRKSLPRHDNRDEHKSSHNKNYYLNHDGDPLSMERRKYYQDKLDNIERRLNRVRNHKRRTVTEDRHMRAMIAPHARKSENQIDSFYIPDRARFLHGY